MRRQLQQLGIQLIQRLLLQLNLTQTIVQTRSGILDALNGFDPATKVAAALTQLRHAIVDPGAPSLSRAIGGDLRLLVPIGVALLTFAAGYAVFRRESPRIAENL